MQQRLKITKKPYASQLISSFYDNVDGTKGRTLFNPFTYNFIKNTKLNRDKVQSKIDEHNENVLEKLTTYIQKSHNKSAIKGIFATYDIENEVKAMNYDFIDDKKYKVLDVIKKALRRNLLSSSLKVAITGYLQFKRYIPAGKEDLDKYGEDKRPYLNRYAWLDDVFCSLKQIKVVNSNDIVQYVDEVPTKFHEKIDELNSILKGSGWKFEKFMSIQINVLKYTPTVGSSFIPLPKELTDKKAIINIKNNDNKCFMWSVLAALYPVEKNAERITNYTKYENLFDWSCVSFPTTIDDIDIFEEKHSDLSINVYEYTDYNKEKKVIPIRLTKKLEAKHINLLLIKDEENENSHYTLIKNYSRLFSSQLTNHHGAIYPCFFCNHACQSKEIQQRHMKKCQQLTNHSEPSVKMPEYGKNTLEFKHHNNKFKAPFALVADFEAILPHSAPNTKNKIHDHLPCSFGVNMITDFDEYRLPPTFYLGQSAEDTMERFYQTLQHYEEHVFKALQSNKSMIMTDEDKENYRKSTHCHICERVITTGEKKVRDHCHITGQYRGAAHEDCNVNFNYKNFKLPVIIHNLKNYDAHFIIQYYKKKTYTKINAKTKQTIEKEIPISVIANNQEKYMSFNIGRLRFIDSFQFLSSSLEKLVENLAKSGYDNFKNTKRYMGEYWQMACQKGIYPYEYMDSFDRFKETQLPSIDKFYSSLNESHTTPEDYEKAVNVWNTLQMKTLKDYHDFYLKCDVFLLSDVFDTFRDAMLLSHSLDPIHYITLPSFSWDAALKVSKIQLELLTDYEMLCMVEKGIRGGISVISHRYAKANNKYMNDYDKTKESSYIIYLDANNLYGEAMCQPLPFEGFTWCNEKFTAQEVMANPSILTSNNGEGYILEVDLEYPNDLHDLHNDFPLAPENVLIDNSMLSPWAKNQQKIIGLHENKTGKLCTTLTNKNKYVLHARNLHYYIEKGMKLTHIHRIISFQQKAWLKDYIDINTQLRKKAKTDFEKDLYKLLNNAVFGKTMESVRNRIEYEIVQTPKRARSITQSPKFKAFKIINDEMVGVQSHKTEVIFNKPIYCGLAILDLSKLHMYKFHYEQMKPKYGDNIKLLGQDTDSLIYHVNTEDLYQDMYNTKELYDFGSYPKEHFLYDPTNNKVQGKFKDETNSIPIVEWVGLAPKMYSIKLDTGKEKGTAKGIKKSFYKNHITHNDYVKCVLSSELKDMRQTCKFLNFRSDAHQITTYEINKYSLTNFDNKRYITNNAILSYAYGHFKTQA